MAYIAGIMHDLGRMGLLAAHTGEYTGLALASHDTVEAILEAEQSAFGMDHCRAGMLLAQAWRLPVMLHSAIEDHHALPAGPCGMRSLMQLTCRLADCLQFQAIHHRDVSKPIEAIESCAPREVQATLAGQLDAVHVEVLDTIQTLDY